MNFVDLKRKNILSLPNGLNFFKRKKEQQTILITFFSNHSALNVLIELKIGDNKKELIIIN